MDTGPDGAQSANAVAARARTRQRASTIANSFFIWYSPFKFLSVFRLICILPFLTDYDKSVNFLFYVSNKKSAKNTQFPQIENKKT